MNKKRVFILLKSQIAKSSPDPLEIRNIKKKIDSICSILNKAIKAKKISASVFLGGSFVKGTIIKKDKYDVDVFVRFDSRKYRDHEISDILQKIVPKNAKRIHASRDYFSLKNEKENIEFEIIPVAKISRPEEARNSTDLSYFHVNYIKEKIKKNKRLVDEIKLAKAFIHYAGCYGAESYISGFSGYSVELLLVYYKTFMNFIKAIAKANAEEKIIIDIEKMYKKGEVMRELNEAKLQSPIILIDPTFKGRNALAALSPETFKRLQDKARKFLKNPSEKFFKEENKEEKFRKRHGKKLQKIILETKSQAGDIAGTKLKKFYNFFLKEASRYFDIDSDFEYDEEKNRGIIYVAAEPKKQIEFPGPPVSMKEPLERFKRQHKKIKIKKRKAYAYENNNLRLKDFIEKFKNEKGKGIEEMGVSSFEIALF